MYKVSSTKNSTHNVETKILQCPNMMELGGPQWTRFSVKGIGALRQLQKKQTPL